MARVKKIHQHLLPFWRDFKKEIKFPTLLLWGRRSWGLLRPMNHIVFPPDSKPTEKYLQVLEGAQSKKLIADRDSLETMPWTPNLLSYFFLTFTMYRTFSLVPGRSAGYFQASFVDERGCWGRNAGQLWKGRDQNGLHVPHYPFSSLPNQISQVSAHYSCQRPDSKYFGLWGNVIFVATT